MEKILHYSRILIIETEINGEIENLRFIIYKFNYLKVFVLIRY